MLSITKINSVRRSKGSAKGGYLFYLGSRSTKDKSDFAEYANASSKQGGPQPFWTGNGSGLMGLFGEVETEQVQRLAEGFHPITGKALVKGAGPKHVMGADLTFSAPKDVSALFAGADTATQEQIMDCMREAVKAALAYTEANSVTRHGKGGLIKQRAEAVITVCYPHFASRALDPQLHIHAFMFNLGKRKGSNEWSALDQKAQFDHKLATGILFRIELADRMRKLGFEIIPDGPYFNIQGISDYQRDALSTRSKEINAYLAERADLEKNGAASREIASLNTRSSKAEPAYSDLIVSFKLKAAELGLTPDYVGALRLTTLNSAADFQVDHEETLSKLTEQKSVATEQDALQLICEAAMGRWSADRCLAELQSFTRRSQVLCLGETEHLSRVITSKSMLVLESEISARVTRESRSTAHRVARNHVLQAFDVLERELELKVGARVDLSQQREAAIHVCSETGSHAFVQGWAGAGKTTALKAVGSIYAQAGFKVLGCSQSAAAAQNLARETGIRSGTIASLLLAIDGGRVPVSSKTVLILDEAGLVGSREFSLLQSKIVDAGGKLVSVGDSRQLQPINAGGIFRALIDKHGAAEISNIQRQRSDIEPLLNWLSGASGRASTALSKQTVDALRQLPDDKALSAIDGLAESNERLAYGVQKWRERFDHKWMREVVEDLAIGKAGTALAQMDDHGRLRLSSDRAAAQEELITAWERDKTALSQKAIIAATRLDVRELNQLARDSLERRGLIDLRSSVEMNTEARDGACGTIDVAPGDRILFTKNDHQIGVANGALATVVEIRTRSSGACLSIRLDDANAFGARDIDIPPSFPFFDHAYCLTNHKSQGRTVDSAHIYIDASAIDREWSYVAASRSRYATTLYVSAASLEFMDPESHADEPEQKTRADQIAELSSRMSRSRMKATTLDYENSARKEPSLASRKMASVSDRIKAMTSELIKIASAPARARAATHAQPMIQREMERGR